MSDDVKIDPDGIYLISAAARLLGVSASTLRDLERRGKIEGTRTPGGQRRFAGSALLRLQEESNQVPSRKSRPSLANATTTNEDAKTRQTWLAQVSARAQGGLPPDTPAEIRLRLGADVDRALGHFGPATPMSDLEPLVQSLLERARLQVEKAQEEDRRHEMKSELVEFGLAQLRRSIDALPTRLVGAPDSLKRRHIRATLRDEFRSSLQHGLRGDEEWDQVRDLAEEFVAAWSVQQTPDSRIPTTVKFLAVGATGVIGGAAATAALSPEIRARMAKLKAPLLSLAGELLNRLSAPPPPPTAPPPRMADPAAAPPRRFPPSVGFGGGWPPSYRRTSRYARLFTSKSPAVPPGNGTASEDQVLDAPPNSDVAPPDAPGAPGPTS